jgi:hypothetical protein
MGGVDGGVDHNLGRRRSMLRACSRSARSRARSLTNNDECKGSACCRRRRLYLRLSLNGSRPTDARSFRPRSRPDQRPVGPSCTTCESAECWLDEPNFAALARDPTAGQSPEAKNENRPSVLSRRPLPHARRARHADWYPHLLSPARWQNRMGDEVIRVACASRAVSVVPRSHKRSISQT